MLTACQLARLLNSQSSIVPISTCNWSPRNRGPIPPQAGPMHKRGWRAGGREGYGTVCLWFHGLQGGWKDWSGEGLLGQVWHPCGPSPPSSSGVFSPGSGGQLAAHPVGRKGERLLLPGRPSGLHNHLPPGNKVRPWGPKHPNTPLSGSQGLKEMENFPSGVTNLSSECQHDAHSPTGGFILDH